MAITASNLEEIKKDVYAKLKPRVESVMEDIAYEIQEHYESFVDKWYEAGPIGSKGHPKYYDRTYDTFFASTGTHTMKNTSSVIETNDGFEGEAGIIVSPANLHGYYDDSAYYVFPRTWEQGIHGTINTGGQTTPPKEMMDKWFVDFKSNVGAFISRRLK